MFPERLCLAWPGEVGEDVWSPGRTRGGGDRMLRLPSTRRLAMFAAVVLVVPATATPVAAADSPPPEPASPAAAGYGFQTVAQNPTAPITVWVDADRSAIAAAFQADHPECPLNAETYDASAGGSDTFHTKISLLDQA